MTGRAPRVSFREAAARCWRGCSLAWLLALWPLPAAALHAAAPASDFHTVTRWAMDEGLPHNLVHSVAQGADGLLWVGTWEGVARFNGRGFTVYDRQNTPGVELGGVFVVMRDPQGGMLFGTAFDGVYRLYRGRWERIGDREARHLQVNALLRDRAGVLWVGSAQTLYRLGEDGRLVDVGHDAGLPEARVTALHETDDRALMVGTERGLYRIDPGTRRATAWGAAR
ncbi:GGDEF domain-containing protein, partial [Xanthomonas sp. Kuri4-1]